MRERQSELDAFDVQLIGVGVREDYQARNLIEGGFGVDLLLDADNAVRSALGAEDQFSRWRLLNPVGAIAYVRAARQAKWSDPIWADTRQRPAILLLDANLDLVWSRVGNRLGDYPSADEVLHAVNSALAGPSATAGK